MGKIILIKKFVCSWWPFEKEFVWESENKKVNIFFWHNSVWKTLIYSSFNSLISWDTNSDFIEEHVADFNIYVEAKINNHEIIYEKSKHRFCIKIDNKEVSIQEYKDFLHKELELNQKLTRLVRWKNVTKNTILSMLRYNFISDNDLFRNSKGTHKKIPIVNTHYDYSCRTPLLAYFLWIDFDDTNFQECCDLCMAKDYIQDHRIEYQKLIVDKNLFDDIIKEENKYTEYKETKKKIFDLKHTIKNLDNLITLAEQLPEIPWINDDLDFLKGQKELFQKLIKDFNSKREKLKKEIERVDDFWKHAMLQYENVESKKDLIFQYEQYQKGIIPLEKKLKPITELYNHKFLMLEEFIINNFKTIPEYFSNTPSLNMNSQKFELKNAVSEWKIISVRILWIILLNIFSSMNWWRIPNILFMDSISEKISEKNSDKWIFTSINNIVNKFTEFPQIFLFISWKKETNNFDFDKLENFQINDLNNY